MHRPESTTNFTQLAAELACSRMTLYRRVRPHHDKLAATGWRPGDKVLFPATVEVIRYVINIAR